MANLIKITTDGTPLAATTLTITTSGLIPANSLAPGDIFELVTTVKKTVATSILNTYIYVNTSNSLIGATQIGVYGGIAGTPYGYIIGRNYVIKSPTSTIGFTSGNLTVIPDTVLAAAYGNFNINWAVDQYIIIAISHSSGASNNSYSTSLLVLKR